MAGVGVLARGDGRTGDVDAAQPSAPGSPPAARGARRVRRLWDRRALVWEHHAAAGLERVVDAVVGAAAPVEGKSVVDLGCGNGQLSLPLARRGGRVLAVDISARMIETVAQKAAEEGLRVETAVRPAQELVMDPASIDLVVSNY